MEKLSFVIPVYNSEKSIKIVIEKIIELVKGLGKYDYEVVLTNDGSTDNSLEVCKDICKNNSKVKLLNLSRNFGQHSAILAAFNNLTGDYVINMDDDLQTNPLEVEKMLNKLIQENYDIVYAKYSNKKHSNWRNIGTLVNKYMAEKMMGKPKDISIGSFYVARRYVIDEVIKYKGPYPYVSGLLLRVTKNIANVEVEHNKRAFGESNYNFRKLLLLWVNGCTNFSVSPIRLCNYFGASIGILSLIMLIISIIRSFFGYSSQNAIFTSLIIIAISINMILMGIVGEYVGRIFMCINNSPQYIIKETFNFTHNNEIYDLKVDNKEIEQYVIEENISKK
ncbi:glycosyltransferase family 2 protein [Clostridium isatidis]|uniref:Glycosyltransferase 2-like domain-containing protein n=1 Tax=Clostridium isatidis TaxID=182773 RepID=A0A343JA94_9CLOT|nr:glycosyltransferase family 2 protein [Clostridium isatidis]ASW42452.1 hypothetical protein BEN51_02840 [Clostridium isatidis]